MSQNNIYFVDKILDKRIINQVIQYKTKWLNYPMSQCSWEPIEHFKDCYGFIEAYEQKERKKKRKKQRSEKKKKKEKAAKTKKQDNEDTIKSKDLTKSDSSSQFEIISIEKIIKRTDGMFAYVKYKSEGKICISEVHTSFFYTHSPELLIKYYESKIIFN